MNLILKALLIYSVLLSHTFAQDLHTWQFAGWYGGGCFPNTVFDSNNEGRVYLASDVAGLWRSDDNGDHWRFATQGLGQLHVAQVVIAPSDSNILYAATKGGVYVSQNAGDSWAETGDQGMSMSFVRPESYMPLAVHPDDPAHVCAGGKGTVICSKNFGKSWALLDPKGSLASSSAAIRAMRFGGDRLWVGTSQGLFSCALNGTCNQFLEGPPKVSDFISSIKTPGLVYTVGTNAVWITRDNGLSWAKSNPIPDGETLRIDIDEGTSPPILRVAWVKNWKGGVMISRDEGKTWQGQDNRITPDLQSDPSLQWATKGGRPTSLRIDPFNPNVILRTDWWAVWRSDDGGESWQHKVVGAPNTVVSQVVVAQNGDIYAATMDNGLLRSRDEGKTYEPLFPVKYDDNKAGHVWRVAVQGDTIVAGSSPWNRKINQLILSQDGGANFSLIRQGLPEHRPKSNTVWGEGYPRALAIDPSNSDRMYAGIDGDDGGGLFVSTDRGVTWNRSPGQPKGKRIYNALSIDPTNTKRILWGSTGKFGGVYISEDGGVTFKHTLTTMSWVFGSAIASDGTMYAAGDSNGAKLFLSRNHGKSWIPAGTFDKGRALVSVAVDPTNPQRIAVGTISWRGETPVKVYLSSDGTRSWQDITGDLPNGGGIASIAFDPAGKYLLIGRSAGSIYKLPLANSK